MNLFNTIKNNKEYWLVDQVKHKGITEADYRLEFLSLLKEWKKEHSGFFSILIDENFESLMFENNLRKISSIVEYTRKLDHLPEEDCSFQTISLSEKFIDDDEYAQIYEQCRLDTANKNIQQPIDVIMNSLKSELGDKWRQHCFYFKNIDQSIVGIAIPIIEMGTQDEGRLFYFGVSPEWREKGIGTILHLKALHLMSRFGARTYVGSTDTDNLGMIQIFRNNGCFLRDRKGIYRIEFN